MTTDTYENPYPGLRAFEAEESHLFFGREGLSEELLRRLCRNHFIAVVGTSGSGKSSLVRAGLLPLLYGGFMPDAGANWRVAVIKPGKNPIRNLAAALARPADYETKALSCSTDYETLQNVGNRELSEDEKLKIAVTETVLRRSAVGLLQYADGTELAPGENLLVVVDQFEEIFRFKEKSTQHVADQSESAIKKPEDEAAAFVKLLIEAVSNKASRVYVVITMRSDFLGDCAQFRNLPETINDGQYLIPRLTREQLRVSIEAPAKVYGAQVTPALVTRLLNDIGEDQDQLPVLQHALMRTWRIWSDEKKPDAPLDVPHYEATGGMAEALSRHANRAYEQLSEERRTTAEKLFKCLTVIDSENREVRRATELGKICAIVTGRADFSPADLDEVVYVINAFRRPGRTFLMPPPDVPLDENTLIDISHESLIRKWDRLREWVAAEAKHSHRYRRLAEDAFADSSFWDDPELREALDWHEEFKPNETWAQLYYDFWAQRELADFPETIKFLNDSRQNRDDEIAEKKRSRKALEKYARNLRYAVVGLLILLLAATGLTIYAFRQQQLADSLLLSEQKALQLNKQYTEQLKESLELNNKNTEQLKIYAVETTKNADEISIMNDELMAQTQQLEKNEEDLQVAFNRQKEATLKAEQSEREKQAAYEKQKQLAIDAESARLEAVDLYEKAEKANARLKRTAEREELNRRGLTSLEKGQAGFAEGDFISLYNSYRDDPELVSNEKQDGLWWAKHNLGTITWRLQHLPMAEKHYLDALYALDKPPASSVNNPVSRPQNSAQTNNEEKDRNKVATLQKLGQLSRERAKKSVDTRFAINYNAKAAEYYEKLLRILRINRDVKDDELYLAGVEMEFADTKYDLNQNGEARKYYEKALTTFNDNNRQQNLPSIIAAENKLSKLDLQEEEFTKAEARIKRVLKIRDEELTLSPHHIDMAESYDNLADIFYSQDKIENQAQEHEQSGNRNQTSEQDKSRTPTQAISQAVPQAEEETESKIKADGYSSLARLIRQWNEIKKTQTRTFDQYENLATSYAAAGECTKAEIVYFEGSKLNDNPNDYKNRMNRLLVIAGFYENILNDDKGAEKYYLDFISETEKTEFVVHYNSATELRQDYYSNFYNTAISLSLSGKYEMAIAVLKRFLLLETEAQNLSSKPEVQVLPSLDRFNALFALAEAYDAIGKTDEAKKMYEDALDLLKSLSEIKSSEYEILEAYILTKQADLSSKADKAKKQKLYEQARIIYVKYLTDSGETNKLKSTNYYPYFNGDYSHLMFRLGEIQRDERNEGGAIKFYEQAVTASNLHLKQFTGTTKQLVEAHNKRAEILESWASLLAGTNRAEKLTEAQTFREKARQVSAESESAKKKCETAG